MNRRLSSVGCLLAIVVAFGGPCPAPAQEQPATVGDQTPDFSDVSPEVLRTVVQRMYGVLDRLRRDLGDLRRDNKRMAYELKQVKQELQTLRDQVAQLKGGSGGSTSTGASVGARGAYSSADWPGSTVSPSPSSPPTTTINRPMAHQTAAYYLRLRLGELDGFKAHADFHTVGFSRKGAYYPWMKDLTKMRRQTPEGWGNQQRLALSDLIRLGHLYRSSKGEDNPGTEAVRQRIEKAIQEE